MKKGDVIYISGKMTGLLDWGRDKFFAAEKKLLEKGAVVLNPARLPAGMPQERYMPICMAMLDQSDVIVRLDNWMESFGAQLERAYADYQGKEIIYEERIESL